MVWNQGESWSTLQKVITVMNNINFFFIQYKFLEYSIVVQCNNILFLLCS